jgi:hypothetical protein
MTSRRSLEPAGSLSSRCERHRHLYPSRRRALRTCSTAAFSSSPCSKRLCWMVWRLDEHRRSAEPLKSVPPTADVQKVGSGPIVLKKVCCINWAELAQPERGSLISIWRPYSQPSRSVSRARRTLFSVKRRRGFSFGPAGLFQHNRPTTHIWAMQTTAVSMPEIASGGYRVAIQKAGPLAAPELPSQKDKPNQRVKWRARHDSNV